MADPKVRTGLRRVVCSANVGGVKRRSTVLGTTEINGGEGVQTAKRMEREVASVELHRRATELMNKVMAAKDRHSTYVVELDGHFTDAARASKLVAEVTKLREQVAAFNAEGFYNPETGVTEPNPHKVRVVFHAPEPFDLIMTPEMAASLYAEIDEKFATVERDITLTPQPGEALGSEGLAACLRRVENWLRDSKSLPGLVPAVAGQVLADAIDKVRAARVAMSAHLRDPEAHGTRESALNLPEAEQAREALSAARGWLASPSVSTDEAAVG